MKRKFTKQTYAEGENSRDDPHSLSDGQSQTLVNMYPGDPSPRPREGNYLWNTQDWPGNVKKLIPYKDDVDGDKVIGVIDRSFYWMRSGDSIAELIGTVDVLPSIDLTISYHRIFDSLFIITDYDSGIFNFIIEWDSYGKTFSLRNASIERPDSSISLLAGTTGLTGLTTDKWYEYAYTFVYRNDSSSKDASGNPIETTVFSQGKNESPDDTDTRETFQLVSPNNKINATLTINEAPDDQITHVRLYRSVGNDSEVEAQGDTKRFLIDIPISELYDSSDPLPQTYEYQDTITNAEITGSLNLIDDMVGKSPIPSGISLLYHNGYLWVGGLNGNNEERGRWFYSTAISDIQSPLKYLSLFSLSTQFVDTSLDDSESNTALGVSQNDLYFIMSKSVSYLRDGDPTTFGPQVVSATRGSSFPNSVTSIDKNLFYLSNEGPASVFSRNVELVEEFTASEVWPSYYAGTGQFFKLGKDNLKESTADPKDVLGFYFKNTWFLTWKDTTVGFYMAPDKRAIGPWTLQFAETSDLRIGSVAVISDEVAVFSSKSDQYYGQGDQVLNPVTGDYEDPAVDLRPWRFLWSGVYTDNLVVYELKSLSKAYYVGGSKRDSFGEAYDNILFSNFTDPGELRVVLTTDFSRYSRSYLYEQQLKTAPLQNQSISDDGSKTLWRRHFQQGFPEGIIGQTYELEWKKNFLPPFDFYIKGFDLSFILRPSQQYEFVSVSEPEAEEALDTELHGKLSSQETPVGIGTWSIQTDTGSGVFTVQGEI